MVNNMDRERLENLLNENKPAEVLEVLLSYKGTDSYFSLTDFLIFLYPYYLPLLLLIFLRPIAW